MHHIHLINYESTWEIFLIPILVFSLFFVCGVWAVIDTIIAMRKPQVEEKSNQTNS